MKEPALYFLRKNGFNIRNSTRSLFSKDKNLTVLFLRAKDIPMYLSEGAVDLGITGYDLWKESGLELKELLDLKFGECDLVLAGKKNSKLRPGARIGTCFPNLTLKYLSEKGIAANIIEISGSVEILPKLGISDLIVDLRSTGITLSENNLFVKDVLLKSSARLLCKKRSKRVMDFMEGVKNDKNL